jgi:hypothetical protein
VAKGECPEPWCLEWCGVDLEDAADNSAIGDYIEIVVVPFAGWAASGRTLEQQRSRHLPSLLRRRTSRLARGGSKTVSVTVQTPPADCPCSGAERVCVEIYSISADATCGVAVAIFVCGYALVTDGTRRPAVAVAISANVLTADPACRIAVPISVGVYGEIAVSACRITRSIRVKAGALGVQRKNGYHQHQRRKNEARHRTPLLLLAVMTLDYNRNAFASLPGRLQKRHPIASLASNDPKAVMLDLVQPLAAGRELVDFGRKVRRDEPGRQGTLQHAD